MGKRGGIVALFSGGSIVNRGTFLSEACSQGPLKYSGGTICFITDTEIVNHGKISCGNDGTVRFFCKKFENRGVIQPAPTVHITDKLRVKRYIKKLAAIKKDRNFYKLDVSADADHWELSLKVPKKWQETLQEMRSSKPGLVSKLLNAFT